MKTIEFWLDRGVLRVILGTVALRDPGFVIDACKAFRGHIAVGVDAKDGFVAVEGWAEVSDMPALDLARKFEDAGVSAIIFTDIARDGLMQGPNVDATIELARAISTPVIASGGVSCMDAPAHAARKRYPVARRCDRRARGLRRCRQRARSGGPVEGQRHARDGAIGMLKARIIPCLDVANGRVVKGVNFVDLVDAGDPVEQARVYDKAGADELTFLDITASVENRDTIYDVVSAHCGTLFYAADGGRWRADHRGHSQVVVGGGG